MKTVEVTLDDKLEELEKTVLFDKGVPILPKLLAALQRCREQRNVMYHTEFGEGSNWEKEADAEILALLEGGEDVKYPSWTDFPIEEIMYGFGGVGIGVYRIDPSTGKVTHRWPDPDLSTPEEMEKWKKEIGSDCKEET